MRRAPATRRALRFVPPASKIRAMPSMVQDDPRHKLIPANAEHRYTVTAEDLPLSCPMPGMLLWNSHPRVYLAIEPSGWAKCSYCGAEFTLLR